MIFARRKRQIAKLLLVEDEPLIAFDNEHFLTDAGFDVVATVDRVADAVGVIGSGAAVDLVLVDVSLADGSGLDVARAAKTRGLPVLFVTGNCPVEAPEVATGCLSKPYNQRDLLTAIDAIEAQMTGKPLKKLPPGLRIFAQEQG